MNLNPRERRRAARRQPTARPDGAAPPSRSARRSRLARQARRAAAVVAVPLGAAVSVLMTPAAGDPSALAAQVQNPDATPFNGTSAVGALFTDKNGKLKHFCTASVVKSPAENLLITAAHCMQGKKLTPAGAVVFAPGYHDGTFPHGRWIVRASHVDSRWKKNQDPNDDVAFLIAGQPNRRIQKYTGAETLETKAKLPQQVQVIGYPDTASLPVTCTGLARSFTKGSIRGLVFDCTGYTDGTSGGPFLANVSSSTGDGKVIGVIGGYEQGGDKADVSYSSRFLANIEDLYKSVTS
jgi:V8-like Glu-specific endopeptidase